MRKGPKLIDQMPEQKNGKQHKRLLERGRLSVAQAWPRTELFVLKIDSANPDGTWRVLPVRIQETYNDMIGLSKRQKDVLVIPYATIVERAPSTNEHIVKQKEHASELAGTEVVLVPVKPPERENEENQVEPRIKLRELVDFGTEIKWVHSSLL